MGSRGLKIVGWRPKSDRHDEFEKTLPEDSCCQSGVFGARGKWFRPSGCGKLCVGKGGFVQAGCQYAVRLHPNPDDAKPARQRNRKRCRRSLRRALPPQCKSSRPIPHRKERIERRVKVGRAVHCAPELVMQTQLLGRNLAVRALTGAATARALYCRKKP